MQFGAEAWPWLVAAVLGVSLAAWLATCGWDRRVVRTLTVFLLARALFDAANGMSLHSGTAIAPTEVLAIATFILPGAALWYYSAYQQSRGVPARWGRLAWPVSILLITLFFINPSWWLSADENGVHAGPLFLVYGLNYLLYAALAFDLGRYAIKETDLRKRRSLLWMGLGFSFLPAYVSSSDFLFIDILGRVDSPNALFLVTHWLSVLGGIVLFALFGLLARNAMQTDDDAHKMDVAAIMGVLILPGITVLLLWLFLAVGVADASATVALEGIWSITSPIFIAMAFARFGAFGLEVKARAGLQWMLLVSLFPLAFGLGWMAGLNSLPNQPTWLVATIFVLILLPFSKWLKEAAGGWADKILSQGGMNE